MPHQVLFIQGGGKDAHDEWDSKLVESLKRELGPDYEIRYPRMPDEADPNYSRWKAALGKEFARLNEGAILVGHSIGGTILISALAEEPGLAMRGVFLLAAPFVGEGGWPSEDIKPMSDLGKQTIYSDSDLFLSWQQGSNRPVRACRSVRESRSAGDRAPADGSRSSAQQRHGRSRRRYPAVVRRTWTAARGAVP